MKTDSLLSAKAYEAPQAELLRICMERNLLLSMTGTAGGQNVTMEDEQDFDDFFND